MMQMFNTDAGGTHHLISHLNQLTRIGLSLSVEKDVHKLLEMIVTEARALSHADAGTLYIMDSENQRLNIAILQNESLDSWMGGTSGKPVTLPDVPLYDKAGKPNFSHVSSHAALTGRVVNIADVYRAEGFDFTGPRRYDRATGYRSISMLVIPMRNTENRTIGVLQLLNAQDRDSGQVIPFSDQYVDLIASLASQAAVALTNAQLIQQLKDLFTAFIKSIATAIDEKSPTTGGHIRRVVELTSIIAEQINATDQEPFGNVRFTRDQLHELRLAAWMHDVGKITTPDHIIEKATRLHAVGDRIELIQTRFRLMAQQLENQVLKKKLACLQAVSAPLPPEFARWDNELADAISQLERDLTLVMTCNQAETTVSTADAQQLRRIGRRRFHGAGPDAALLSEDEIRHLTIVRGTLTDEERVIIENHARMTHKILAQLPFPKELANVPAFAGAHHERLDGSGYPRQLTAAELPLQSRIMAIADIFEALTARDRPYKKPMPLTRAVAIMSEMKDSGHIDADIFDLFIGSEPYLEYVQREMSPDQIDVDISRSGTQGSI